MHNRKFAQMKLVVAVAVAVTVVVVVIVVAQNERMCLALDMQGVKDNRAEEVKETAHSWADQMSGQWVDKQESTPEGVGNSLEKAKDVIASDGKNKYACEKAGTISDVMPSLKDKGAEFYDEAKHKAREACDLVAENDFSEAAKANYEAAKEKASDAAGEVGAEMRY